MTTRFAIISHAFSDGDRPEQKKALNKVLCQLENFVGENQQAVVLSSPLKTVASYAEPIAGHFVVELETCEGLLRDGNGDDVVDGCDCVGDYIGDNRFGLVVVVAGADITRKLAGMLSARIGRTFTEMFAPGTSCIYLI